MPGIAQSSAARRANAVHSIGIDMQAAKK